MSFGDSDFLLVKEGRMDILSLKDEMENRLSRVYRRIYFDL